MPRANQADVTRSRPLALEALVEYGALTGFPESLAFDPAGSWTHTYRVWLVGTRNRNDGGSLSIERRPAGNDAIALNVVQSVRQSAGTVHETKAEIECQYDRLCTPRAWRLQSVILDAEGQPIELTKVEQVAVAGKRSIETTLAGAKAVRLVPWPFTSNWSLFAAVQHLPGEGLKPFTFTLLEDLDLMKGRHRLSFGGTCRLELGGRVLELQGYQQIGDGVLPYHYWLDEGRRLVCVISGIRAYILDSIA